jgi:hypothetical protein
MRRKRSKASAAVFHLLPVASFMGNEYTKMIFMSRSWAISLGAPFARQARVGLNYQQDIYRTSKHGMSPELEEDLTTLCTEYRQASAEYRNLISSAISRKATWFLLAFVHRLSTHALQQKDIQALNLGLIALGLSNIVNIDWRDGMGGITQLAYVAELCGLKIADQAIAVIPDLSPKLLDLIKKLTREPIVMHLKEDADGKPIFWKTCKATASTACPVCHEKKPS